MKRTFGWAQDASNLETLRKVIRGLIKDTDENTELQKLVLKYVVDENLANRMLDALTQGVDYPYTLLKGTSGVQLSVEQNIELFDLSKNAAIQKTKKGGRANASCTGIIQLSLPAQNKSYYKPYQNDWSAESYLKLAISLDLIQYDAQKDVCNITKIGNLVATTDGKELEKNYISAMMVYPPAVRVLQILAEDMQAHTKFDIGSKLGFIGEAGFGSLDMGYFLWSLNFAESNNRSKIKSNKEKMCDKYARMTCSMLISLGLVAKARKSITAEFAGITYGPEELLAYKITPKGYDVLNNSYGHSSHSKVLRLVMYETLATAAPDREFLRFRRANILQYLSKKCKSLDEIRIFLNSKGVAASNAVIENDLCGFRNIGLRIEKIGDKYKLQDNIYGLEIPKINVSKREVTEVKERVIERVKNIPHRYFEMVDLAFLGGKQEQSREFEEITAELLTEELLFKGEHLGGSNKPDIAVYYNQDGIIIDTKAYEKGFSISAHQRDEMSRYINDNQKRDLSINPNAWWEVFPISVSHFNHLFVSSFFTGQFSQQLSYIAQDKGQNGAAITAENLLYLADELKSGVRKYEDVKKLMQNTEIII